MSKIKKIAISGWEETTDKELIPFIHDYYDNGITKTICTDINRDGMLQGPAIELYKEIQEQIPLLYLIASGGISSIQDIEKLAEAGIPAVIFGKAIYGGKDTAERLDPFHLIKIKIIYACQENSTLFGHKRWKNR